jgi:hypothetical protein
MTGENRRRSTQEPLRDQHGSQRWPGKAGELRQSLQAAGTVKQAGQWGVGQATEQLDSYKRGSARVALQPGISIQVPAIGKPAQGGH